MIEVTAKIIMKDETEPIFVKPYTAPLGLKTQIEQEFVMYYAMSSLRE